MGLTHRDNFWRLMRHGGAEHQGAHRLALEMPMTPPVRDELQRRYGTRSPEEAFDLPFRYVGARIQGTGQLWKQRLAELGCQLPEHANYGTYGSVESSPPLDTLGKAWHLTTMHHPLEVLQSVDQLPALPWPRFDDPASYAHLPDAVADIQRKGLVAYAGMECTIFEHAWYARGMDNLMLDIAEENGIADWLLDFHTERSAALGAGCAAAGCDVIGLGDDIGTQRGMMLAPDFWRRHLKPRLARVVNAIRAHQRAPLLIRYHSDGDIRDVVDDLLELGIDVLNPVQPECMPHEQVIPQWKDRCAFWGLIGTQTTMPFGTPDDVRDAVRKLADFVQQGARITLAPTHVLEPDVPWENIEALVDEARRQPLR